MDFEWKVVFSTSLWDEIKEIKEEKSLIITTNVGMNEFG